MNPGPLTRGVGVCLVWTLLAGVKPRHAQERHSHPMLTPDSDGGRYLRSWSYASNATSGFSGSGASFTLSGSASQNMADFAVVTGPTVPDCQRLPRVVVSGGNGGGLVSARQWATGHGFSVRFVWGHRVVAAGNRGFCGLFANNDLDAMAAGLLSADFSAFALRALGVCKDSGSMSWQWCWAPAGAGSGGVAATGLPVVADAVYSLQLDCDPRSETVDGLLLNLGSGDSSEFTFTDPPNSYTSGSGSEPYTMRAAWGMMMAPSGVAAPSNALMQFDGQVPIRGVFA